MKTGWVIGSAGQDGSLLVERLRSEFDTVIAVRRDRLTILPSGHEERFSVLALDDVVERFQQHAPDELYYVAAHHHSSEERDRILPLELFERSHDVHVRGFLNVLEAARRSSGATRILYAASALVFGETLASAADEDTAFRPESVYGITKATAVHCGRLYREQYGVRVSVAFLFSHESPRRRADFLSQRLIREVRAIARGEQAKLVIGDLGATVDWGYAPDYVDAMIRINRLPESDEFIVATGETHTVGEFVAKVFACAGLDWRAHVEERPELVSQRGTCRSGNPAKLRRVTGWSPSITFDEMIETLWRAAGDGS